MARYFFRAVPSPSALADFISITEQLTEADMRCLAVLKRARLDGYFERRVAEGADPHRVDREMNIGDAFPDQRSFNEAVIALVRFGFTYMGSAWGGIALSITARGLDYIDSLDFDGIDMSEEEGL